MLELKRDGSDVWTPCFQYPRAMDYTVHTYISAGGRKKERRGVFINSIKFYDNEKVIEGEQEVLDTKAFRDFKGTASDLLHEGNVDGVLLKDEQKGKDAYNDKILKYNSKYAQLVGKQKANVDGIAQIYQSLPHVDLMDTIRKDIHDLDSTQLSFTEHFDEFRGLIQFYTNEFIEMRKAHGGEIMDENFAKEEAQLKLGIDKNDNTLQNI